MIETLVALFAAALLTLAWGAGVFNPLSGILGSVKIGATEFAFSKWSVEMKCVVVKANNFTSSYQMVVPGLISATVTLEALTYDEGNMPFAVGNFYTFILAYTNAVSITLNVMIESISPSVDVEGGQPIKISGQSDGAFTAAIT